MLKNILIFLFLLCIGELICGVHGDTAKAVSPSIIATIRQDVSSVGRRITNIPKAIIRMIRNIISSILNRIKNLLISAFEFLASSDDTRLSRVGGNENYNGKRRHGGTISNILSSIVKLPFKIVYRTVSKLPVNAVYKRVAATLQPVNEILASPALGVITNVSTDVIDFAAERAWNFTKASVLPRVDNLITTLHKSNTLPESVMIYLQELQTLYHLMHFIGVA